MGNAGENLKRAAQSNQELLISFKLNRLKIAKPLRKNSESFMFEESFYSNFYFIVMVST